MKQAIIARKDFSEWVELAEKAPSDFEAMRLAAINDFIESVPEENRERLRCLQWRIDQERRLAQTPMAACIRLSHMMWKNVLGENGLRDRFEQLKGLLAGQETPATERADRGARVITFERTGVK